MQNNEKNEEKTDYERAYLGYQEFEALLNKPDKTSKEQKRMEVLYDALRNEAPYLLNLFD